MRIVARLITIIIFISSCCPLQAREEKTKIRVRIENYSFSQSDEKKIKICFENNTFTEYFAVRKELGDVFLMGLPVTTTFCSYNHYFLEQHGGRINTITAINLSPKTTTCFSYDMHDYCDFNEKKTYKLKIEIVYFEYTNELKKIQLIKDNKEYYNKLISIISKMKRYSVFSNVFDVTIK